MLLRLTAQDGARRSSSASHEGRKARGSLAEGRRGGKSSGRLRISSLLGKGEQGLALPHPLARRMAERGHGRAHAGRGAAVAPSAVRSGATGRAGRYVRREAPPATGEGPLYPKG